MVYAVIDTNIFVSAFITKNATASTRRVIICNEKSFYHFGRKVN